MTTSADRGSSDLALDAGAGESLRPGLRVIVSHPVHQHSYETVVAAQQLGVLEAFYTGLYDTGRGLSDPRLRRVLPPRQRDWVEGVARRRRHPEVDPAGVRVIPRHHLAGTVLRRATGDAPPRAIANLGRMADAKFDRSVSRRLRRHPNAHVVHAYEGSALSTFEAAARLGIRRVLDVPAAHEYASRLLAEEAVELGMPDPTGEIKRYTPRIQPERDAADVLLAPSEFVRSCLLDHGTPDDRIRLVPYGVDPERFHPTPPADDVFRVVFTGTIGLRKGVRYLLEAWRRLALPRAELLLLGSPDDAGRRLLAEYEGHYRWLGQLPKIDVAEVFGSADVFVLPSLAEGSALVTYEAMALGLPIVTTPNSGSWVRDGVDGFIVPSRSVEQLMERLEQLYRDRDLVQTLGMNGREFVVANLTWDHYRERLAGVYAELQPDEDDHTSRGVTRSADLTDEDVEAPPCVICGGTTFDPVRPACPDRRHWMEPRFDIVRCSGCALVQTNPRPSPASMGRFYPAGYSSFANNPGGRGGVAGRVRDALRVPYLLRYRDSLRFPAPPRPGARLLDVGSGAGALLDIAQRAGWEVYGIEPHEAAAEESVLAVGLSPDRILRGAAEDVDLPAESFDLVTMHHVIEHLHDPKTVVESVRRWLRPGGAVNIRCPDFGSFERRLFGEAWMGLDMPRHLYHFEEATLRRLLADAGLDLERIVPEFQVSSFAGSVVLAVNGLRGGRRQYATRLPVYHALFPLVSMLLAAGARPVMDVTARRR